jgi:hypothetical protein
LSAEFAAHAFQNESILVSPTLRDKMTLHAPIQTYRSCYLQRNVDDSSAHDDEGFAGPASVVSGNWENWTARLTIAADPYDRVTRAMAGAATAAMRPS